MSDNRIVAHMFWAYGPLSNLEKLCIKSFLANDYVLNVWTYGDIPNLPDGAILKNASDILPENRVFTYENGSYAAFANLFRYALLSLYGGLYSDTDVICMMPASALGKEPFFVSERNPNCPGLMVNNNLIYSPSHAPRDIIDLAYVITDRYPIAKLRWGDCGPKLLTMLAQYYSHLSFKIMLPDFANSIDHIYCPHHLLLPGQQVDKSAKFLHCYNEQWRQAGVDKNAAFPAKSIMAKFAAMYL